MTALSGSQFKPPSLPEVTDFALKNLVLWARIFTLSRVPGFGCKVSGASALVHHS